MLNCFIKFIKSSYDNIDSYFVELNRQSVIHRWINIILQILIYHSAAVCIIITDVVFN